MPGRRFHRTPPRRRQPLDAAESDALPFPGFLAAGTGRERIRRCLEPL